MSECSTATRSEENPPGSFRRVPFEFRGDGGEFFRIWIVNIVLTVLTLGIYSAWATVRTNRYFYGNTYLDGDAFDYLASPVNILIGRAIAVFLLIIYNIVWQLMPGLGLLLSLALLIFIPQVVLLSLRFGARMTAWRGVRFGFGGDLIAALKAYILWPIVGILTLGLGLPYVWYRQNRFLIPNYRLGTTSAETSAKADDFLIIIPVVLGIGFIGAILAFIMGSFLFTSDEPTGVALYSIVAGIGYLAIYVGIYAATRALYLHATYNNISLGNNSLRSSISVWGFFKVVMVNTLLTIITLGFFYPWAQVRTARYLQNNLWVEAEDLESFVADEQEKQNALGEEVGEAFDLGIGI